MCQLFLSFCDKIHLGGKGLFWLTVLGEAVPYGRDSTADRQLRACGCGGFSCSFLAIQKVEGSGQYQKQELPPKICSQCHTSTNQPSPLKDSIFNGSSHHHLGPSVQTLSLVETSHSHTTSVGELHLTRNTNSCPDDDVCRLQLVPSRNLIQCVVLQFVWFYSTSV